MITIDSQWAVVDGQLLHLSDKSYGIRLSNKVKCHKCGTAVPKKLVSKASLLGVIFPKIGIKELNDSFITKKQFVELSVSLAEALISLFEAKHPNDNRPRKAIEAAKNWISDPSDHNKKAAAYAAAYAAYAAYADAAARTAYAAAYAAYATATATYAAYAAGAAVKRTNSKIDIDKIIEEWMKTL